ISILLPAMQKAREQAIKVECASNLRQVGQAFHMYTNESKGAYPPPPSIYHWPFGAMVLLFENPPSTPPGFMPVGQALLFDHKYLKTGRVLYCPAARGSDIFTFEKMWHPKPGTWYITYVGYPYWARYRCWADVNGHLPANVADRSKDKSTRLLSSDMVTTAGGVQTTAWSGHLDRAGRNAGGNVLLNDGSVHWRPFKEMKIRFTYVYDFWF
ncbi:MAG: hypothetical protein ABIP55_00505, partial [Tepidisphaeraceae bacterium]